MSDFKMPSLGADMDDGTLAAWKVKPGDHVRRGDIIADVETAKGIIEIEVFEDGVIDALLIEAGKTVPVGEVIARICTEAELAVPGLPKTMVVEVQAAGAVFSTVPVVAAAKASLSQPPIPSPGVQPGEQASQAAVRIRISPLARRVAEDLHLDLRNVKGTGPGGAILRADIDKAARELKAVPVAQVPAPALAAVAVPPPATKEESVLSAVAPAPVVEEAKPASEKKPLDFQAAMRQAIAAAMSRSNRDIPHYYLEMHINMRRALQWLEEENLKRSIKDRILPVVLLLKAVALSLVDVPELNGFWVDDHLQVSEAINIGFAISLRQGGLVTPAIHHVDLKTIDELRDAVTDLILRTRAGRLRSSELTDPTVTVTSLGDRGVEKVFGVIYPPQVALVGFGKVLEQPWAENGLLGVQPMLIATLAGDHRATDGHRGALFLEALNRHLQEVEKP